MAKAKIRLTHNGHTRTLLEWQRETGIPAQVIRIRMQRYGWDAAKALTTPVHTPIATRRTAIRARARYHAQRCAEYAAGRRIEPLTVQQVAWSLDFSMLPPQKEHTPSSPADSSVERGRKTRAAIVNYLERHGEGDTEALQVVAALGYSRTLQVLRGLVQAGVIVCAEGGHGHTTNLYELADDYEQARDDYETTFGEPQPALAIKQFRAKQKAHG